MTQPLSVDKYENPLEDRRQFVHKKRTAISNARPSNFFKTADGTHQVGAETATESISAAFIFRNPVMTLVVEAGLWSSLDHYLLDDLATQWNAL